VSARDRMRRVQSVTAVTSGRARTPANAPNRPATRHHHDQRRWRARRHHDVKLVERAGAILTGDKPRWLVLDFAGVLFIDSTGLAGLIKLRTLADTIGSHMEIHDVPRNIRIFINYAGLAEHLRVKPAADPDAYRDPT